MPYFCRDLSFSIMPKVALFHLVLIPEKVRVRENVEGVSWADNFEVAFVKLGGQLSLPLLDLTPTFVDQTKAGAVLYNDNDGHWNSAGRRIAAEALAVLFNSLTKQ